MWPGRGATRVGANPATTAAPSQASQSEAATCDVNHLQSTTFALNVLALTCLAATRYEKSTGAATLDGATDGFASPDVAHSTSENRMRCNGRNCQAVAKCLRTDVQLPSRLRFAGMLARRFAGMERQPDIYV